MCTQLSRDIEINESNAHEKFTRGLDHIMIGFDMWLDFVSIGLYPHEKK